MISHLGLRRAQNKTANFMKYAKIAKVRKLCEKGQESKL